MTLTAVAVLVEVAIMTARMQVLLPPRIVEC